jgi:signal transduction histidine kinase
VVRAWREDDWLCFGVEDAGAGIPASERDLAFVPFVRGAAVRAATRGTGLGLAIARQLATVQRGRLDYEPNANAQSRFVLRVPASRADESL